MPKYRKKPLVVDAFRFNEAGDNGPQVIAWAMGHAVTNAFDQNREIFIHQLAVPGNEDNVYHTIATRCADGVMLYSEAGDWIIRGEAGEFHIISDEQFNKIYEPVVIIKPSEIIQ